MQHIELGSVERRNGNSTYHWKIPNFSEHTDINVVKHLASPLFSTSNIGDGFKWQMKLTAIRYRLSSRRFISLYVECLSHEFRMATISAGVIKNNGTILEGQTKEYKKRDTTLSILGIAEMVFLLNQANEILNDDVLTIQCTIKMGKIQPVRHFSSIKVSPITYKKNQLSREVSLRLEEFDDFESILNDRNFSDVSISIEGKTIMACKLILMKKSPVFAAMFRADMKERNKNAVLIEDIKYDIFMELLRFIYSGKVRQLETIAVDLLAAVDKYRMENLKTMCELEPIKQMGIDDAVRMLKLADKYRAKKLKKRAIEYIVENKIDIFDQAEFRGLDKELMYNICQAIK